MKTLWITWIFISVCSTSSAQQGQLLMARHFYDYYNATGNALLIDVRTPAEYSKGFIPNAIHFDFYDKDFKKNIQRLDSTQVLFVYCQSGGRSAEAVEWMRQNGYPHVYELKDGYNGWKKHGLPVNELFTVTDKLSRKEFNKAISSGKVLVDFYAPWCGPCKKMEPYLKEIELKFRDKVKVLRINVDENENLSNELKVRAIPLLQIYQDGKKVWEYNSYLSKSKLFKALSIQEP